ncbi:MAG: hypothetical protein LBM09_03245 [Candidatus Nomurabacteria bacterium]|jgi:hypothetical protein|nr:hypothetical protein [Candidatus Nomurabacteria bacterium]
MEQPEKNVNTKKTDVWKILSIIFAVLLVTSLTFTGIFAKQSYDQGLKNDEIQEELNAIKDKTAESSDDSSSSESGEDTATINSAEYLKNVLSELKTSFPDKKLGDLISVNYSNESSNGNDIWRAKTHIRTGAGEFDDAVAMFYRIGNDSEWKYFASVQSDSLCEDYNTDELKEAFAEERCYYYDTPNSVGAITTNVYHFFNFVKK